MLRYAVYLQSAANPLIRLRNYSEYFIYEIYQILQPPLLTNSFIFSSDPYFYVNVWASEGGAGRSLALPWILKFSAKKGCFPSFEWDKSNFTTFGRAAKM